MYAYVVAPVKARWIKLSSNLAGSVDGHQVHLIRRARCGRCKQHKHLNELLH